MRVLHVGFGFSPWIVNGLVIHSEAIMDGQVAQGHDVGYFFAARQLPGLRRPFLHRWRRRGVEMFEWVNSDLVVGRHRGTASPDAELSHPPSEAAFAKVLRRFRPEVIHVHDLGGLPSSILELARGVALPTVVTIHDYHLLCPTVKLYDAHDRICLRRDPGAMCAVCCAQAPADNREELERTLVYIRRRVGAAIPSLDDALGRARVRRAGAGAARLLGRVGRSSSGLPDGPSGTAGPPRASAEAYQRRRDVNVERLNRVEALIASSRRSAEIYRQLGVSEPRIEILPVNPPHIERLRPRGGEVGGPLQFIALNACSSTQKGAELVVGALSRLGRYPSRYRVAVYGPIAPQVEAALRKHPCVEIGGEYRPAQLDALLEAGDVGLLPSVWEEVYGYAGIEFLAKGIPVIGNAVGAIPEYVRPGETGWLNQSGTAEELATLMAVAIEHPAEVGELRRRTAARRPELIEPLDSALARLAALYAELWTKQGGPM
jgi:glycosyltransferase involved in cell wall biosynthesis